MKSLKDGDCPPSIACYHASIRAMIGKTPGNLLVMDYIDGEPLSKYLVRGSSLRLTLDEIIQIGEEMKNALKWMHSRRIAHRDINDGNIIFGKRDGDDRNHAYLIDFGEASDNATSEDIDDDWKNISMLLRRTVYWYYPKAALPLYKTDQYVSYVELLESLRGGLVMLPSPKESPRKKVPSPRGGGGGRRLMFE